MAPGTTPLGDMVAVTALHMLSCRGRSAAFLESGMHAVGKFAGARQIALAMHLLGSVRAYGAA